MVWTSEMLPFGRGSHEVEWASVPAFLKTCTRVDSCWNAQSSCIYSEELRMKKVTATRKKIAGFKNSWELYSVPAAELWGSKIPNTFPSSNTGFAASLEFPFRVVGVGGLELTSSHNCSCHFPCVQNGCNTVIPSRKDCERDFNPLIKQLSNLNLPRKICFLLV